MTGSNRSVRWVIEHRQTGEWLGTNTRLTHLDEAEFGARVPLLFHELRTAKHTWIQYGLRQEYFEAGVSLRKPLGNIKPGANASAKPPILFKQIMLVDTLFSVWDRDA